MARRDEGVLKTVGWGPFALPGERKRLRKAEDELVAEVEATPTTPGQPLTPDPVPAPDPGTLPMSAAEAHRARMRIHEMRVLDVDLVSLTIRYEDDFIQVKLPIE